MAYSYYCTHCGKELSQDTVLFDMQYLLTRDDTRQFNILKFRMTQAELKAFLASGTPGEDGYHTCRLTLTEIMKFVGNANNLNNADIATLTLAEIDEYINAISNFTSSAGWGADDYDDYADDFEEEEGDELSAEPVAPYVKPQSVEGLEKIAKDLVDEIFVKDLLSKDLSVLQSIFAENEFYEFQLREENDTDNEGQPVLDGYCLVLENGLYGREFMNFKARVCGRCSTQVFEHAGTAPQKIVTFLGWGLASKTATILALVHYATNHMVFGLDDSIWKDAKPIDSVAYAEFLYKNGNVTRGLSDYPQGLGPQKYSLHCGAFSPTIFRIRDRNGKYHIFTIQDTPVEIAYGGYINWKKVHEEIPGIFNSDAFVLCLDAAWLTNDKRPGVSVAEMITQSFRYLEEIQGRRAQHNGVTTNVPTMLLFTKCPELEDTTVAEVTRRVNLPLDSVYLLKEEKRQIATNSMYCLVNNTFSRFYQLDKSYHAAMRCTAYGHYPCYEGDVERGGVTPHPPTPKNIDLLMRWLLSVTGCIPTEAKLDGKPGEQTYRVGYRLERPQFRSQNPLPGKEVEESMARCALFENPGYFDREFVLKHDRGPFVLGPVRLDAKLHPDTNDR